ncbi:MAG: CRISPR/Cas system-associated exonuclease Cas4 [Thermodesulfobacterium sp.]|uniref:CRISPR-associated exonuclease Cas4 n=1 Tax=Candidatus Thermodesulfobacterium syntrophicum TaxID=3060442 RepID=A0AAE3P6A7_9BACT|nr:CRISPR/Cas system-associated exonuclease Cas4 [Candidatus Thermodesulfobacterium syntrophicum]
MSFPATLIWYYYICPREVWLMSRQLTPWQDNPFIEIGRLISEESYKREKKEIHIENMVIDLLKIDEENIVICEIKKSSRFEKSAKMQLAYYLLRLKQLGISATGQLLFPKERKKLTVTLTKEIEDELISAQREIKSIIQMEMPPPAKKTKYCSKCGYREFCWS